VDGERQRGGRRHRLWMRDMEVRFNTFIEVFQRRPTLCFLVKKNARMSLVKDIYQGRPR
jgi:hypothetical protein